MTGVEIELKFQVPAAARAALLRALAGAGQQVLRLRAAYADTADQRLAAAGLALRLRQEDRRWVQTLKGRGDGLLARLEHEVALPPQRGRPALDPARHAGSDAGAQLARVLADGTPLQERYRTDIRRTLRRVRSGSALVEIAFDEGVIVAGGASLPVCEVEFELVSGAPTALLALAERWALRHGLWLDVRTKSERGHRLALGLATVPATMAAPSVLPTGADSATAFGALLQAALGQALPNAAEIASGSGAAEHRHQLRVALRRLRTALRLFAPWAADADAALALERRWREPFAALGAARDADMLAGWLPQALAAAGGPPLPLPAAALETSAALLRAPVFSALVLQTLQLALAPSVAQPLPLAIAARGVLKPLWQQVRADIEGFGDADTETRHRTRRRLKRLRYTIEFVQPALPARAAERVLAALRRALEILGECNDLRVAQARMQALPAPDAATWFALGWLAGRLPALEQRAARRVAALADLPRFWPRG